MSESERERDGDGGWSRVEDYVVIMDDDASWCVWWDIH